MEWLLVTLSILGTWFNIRKNPICWLIWSTANIGWIWTFLDREMVAETTLFIVYLTLSVYGLRRWRREQRPCHRIIPFRISSIWHRILRINTQASGQDSC